MARVARTQILVLIEFFANTASWSALRYVAKRRYTVRLLSFRALLLGEAAAGRVISRAVSLASDDYGHCSSATGHQEDSTSRSESYRVSVMHQKTFRRD